MAGSVSVLLKILGDSSSAVNATSRLGAALNAVGAQAQQLTQRIATSGPGLQSSMETARQRTVTALSNSGKIFTTASKGIQTFREQLMNTNDTLRLAAQGVTNFGRSMMFFVSVPLTGLFTGMAHAATEFEDGLTRVRKTTGFTAEQVRNLGEGLRGLAVNTASSHTELVEIASILGQMADWEDLDAPIESLTKLTETISVFAVSTDQSGSHVASAMGKIANAFGWNLGESTDSVERLANVINLLENKTAATAGEIMTTLQEFAPFATMLNMSAADATAFSAALVSVGLSASESGTALKNMGIYIARNAEDVSRIMSGYSDAYRDADSVLEAFGQDAAGVLLDILDAASRSEDQVGSMLNLLEVADMRGGRGLAALRSNVDLLRSSLSQARSEWEAHSSLLEEYNLAMTSTKSQIAVLKNNIADAGIIMGDALLPPLRAIMQVAVPAIRMLADAFKKLSQPVQVQVIALAGLVVILGPILMFLGQMVHAATLIVMGFGQALRVVSFFVAALGRLGPVIAAVGANFLTWPVLITGVIALILKLLDQMGYDIAGYFRRLAVRAKTWGENLSKNIGSGLISGAVRFVSAAISKIAGMIASFFESHSPPQKGPLSTIDQWGISLMETFLQGFKAADFSILEDVSSIIEKSLTAGLEGEPLVAALRKLAGARVNLSKLISQFNETGFMDENLLTSVTSGLGEIGDNVRDLIRLSLEYEKIQRAIADIEVRRKQLLSDYSAEIAAIGASDMNVTGKVDAIRAAKRRRDSNLIQLDKEKDALEQQADLVKQQLDAQKALIDSLQEQEDIFLRIAELLKEIAEDAAKDDDAGGTVDPGSGFDVPDIDLNDLNLGALKDGLDDATQKTKDLFELFDRGKEKLQGFLDAWNGRERKSFTLPADSILGFTDEDLQEGYDTMYKLGETARKTYDKVAPTLKGIGDAWTNFIGSFKAANDESGEAPKKLSFIEAFLAGITERIRPEDLENFATGLKMLSDGFETFMAALGYVDTKGAGGGIAGIIDLLAKTAGQNIGLVITFFVDLAGWIMYVWGLGFKFEAWLVKLGISIGNFFGGLKAWFEPARKSWIEMWAGIQQSTEEAWDEISAFLLAAWDATFVALARWLVDIGTEFAYAWDDMVHETIDSLIRMDRELTDRVNGMLLSISLKATEFKNVAAEWMQGLIDGITGKAKALIDTITGVVSKAVEGLQNFLGGDIDPSYVGGGGGLGTTPPKKGRWTGGPVTAGGTYVVGEFGPELFSPNSNGSILSNHNLLSALSAAGAAGEVNIQITINNPVVRDDSDIRKLADQVSAELVSRINRRTSFGGNIPI